MKLFLLFLIATYLFISTSLFSKNPETYPETNHQGHEEARVKVELTKEQQDRVGLKVTRVERKPIEPVIRTVGTITTDQRKEVHVHTRVNGWIEELLVDYVGKQIRKGDPLFRLYSPDLVSTQQEYLTALKLGLGKGEAAQASLARLRYFGVPKSEIKDLQRTGKIKRLITFESPIDGYVVSKNAIQGQYITPELELYYLANLSNVWALITLYEFDLSFVKVGDTAKVTLSYEPAKSFEGKISYLYPEIDPQTRTSKARVEINTPQGDLKPGTYANVEIRKNLGEALVIPEDSVIDTGMRKVVFMKKGETGFEPREVKLGTRVSGQFVILQGLQEGEWVVNSANFLLDTESKFRAAIQKGAPSQGGHGGH